MIVTVLDLAPYFQCGGGGTCGCQFLSIRGFPHGVKLASLCLTLAFNPNPKLILTLVAIAPTQHIHYDYCLIAIILNTVYNRECMHIFITGIYRLIAVILYTG